MGYPDVLVSAVWKLSIDLSDQCLFGSHCLATRSADYNHHRQLPDRTPRTETTQETIHYLELEIQDPIQSLNNL